MRRPAVAASISMLVISCSAPSASTQPSLPGPGPTPGSFDIRKYGALPFNSGFAPSAYDASGAIDAMLAEMATQTWGPGGASTGAGTFGQGVWWISRPIWLDVGHIVALRGAGQFASFLRAGVGDPVGGPGYVPGFSGPLLITGRGTFEPTYTAALVGTGRSLHLSATSTQVELDDAYWWRSLDGMPALTVRENVKFTNNGRTGPIGQISSRGNLYPSLALTESAFGVYVRTDGIIRPFLHIQLTTTDGVHVWAGAAGSLVFGHVYNIEIDFNGKFVDFYLDGVNVLHQAASGTVVQKPWETVCIGQNADTNIGEFEIQSLELRKVATHTGTGGFSVPKAAYLADASTLALYNWDQGDAPKHAPLVIGLVRQAPGFGGLVKHYARLPILPNSFGYVEVRDLGFQGNNNASGLIVLSTPRSQYRNLYIGHTTQVGFDQNSGSSFYDIVDNVFVDVPLNIGLKLLGGSSSCAVAGGKIGAWVFGGNHQNLTIQPNTSTLISIIASSASVFSPTLLTGCSVDDEGAFPNYMAGLWLDNPTAFKAELSSFGSAGSSPPVPPVTISGTRGQVTFTQSTFTSSPGIREVIHQSTLGSPRYAAPVTVDRSLLVGTTAPWSLGSDFVVELGPDPVGKPLRASATATQAGGPRGTVDIAATATRATVTFAAPQPDASYGVALGLGNKAGRPATASAKWVQKTPKGFGIVLDAAPGPGAAVTVDWQLLR